MTSRWRRGGASLAFASATGVAVFGLVRGTTAVGGSDSSCYALMADAFANGDVQPFTPLATEAPWPDAPRTFAPAGFIPSPKYADRASPICSPGFSLLLAPFRWAFGRDGIFLLTPLTGFAMVWLVFVFTRRLAGDLAGAAAAVLVATTPIVLFQVVQPMNDIGTAALWMAVLSAAIIAEPTRSWILGATTGLAVLVRPNLAPVAAVVVAWLIVRTIREEAYVGPALRRRLLAFALACAPSIGCLLWLNAILYGHALRVGHGAVGNLFGLQHVRPNIVNYGSALIETELGVPLLGIAAGIFVASRVRHVVWLAVLVAAATIVVYLGYQSFAEWWYLRFLLPAVVPLTALAVVVALGIARWALSERRYLAATILIIATAWLSMFNLRAAREHQVFEIQRLESRFRHTGEIVRERLPNNSVFITVWHSGTIRFHADRPSMLWDSLDPAWLDPAIEWFTSRHLDPYIVVEEWEEPLFRQRFSRHSVIGDLDWPPRFDIDRQVRIFKPSDRSIYMSGGVVPTEHLLPRF